MAALLLAFSFSTVALFSFPDISWFHSHQPEPSGFVFSEVTSCQLKGCAWTCIYSYPVPVAGQNGVIYTTFPLSVCHTSHCQVCSRCPALPWILHFHLITSFIAAISRWWVDDFFFFFVLFVSLLNAKTHTHTPLKKPSFSGSPPILPSQS